MEADKSEDESQVPPDGGADANARSWEYLKYLATAPPTPAMQKEGWLKARQLVNEAVGEYTVRRSPDALQLLALVNDILHECTPDNWTEFFVDKVAGPIGRLNALKQEALHARRQAADDQINATRAAVKEEFEKLLPSQQTSSAASLISAKMGLSPPTVRAHLVALGLRKARKRK